MIIDLKTCTEEQLWKYIATELAKNDVDVILVANKHPVNMSKIKKWCEDEKHPEVFDEFLRSIKK